MKHDQRYTVTEATTFLIQLSLLTSCKERLSNLFETLYVTKAPGVKSRALRQCLQVPSTT
jgi:hypothetical protein